MDTEIPPVPTVPHLPDAYTVEWIENEGLLRDEGCITGGAGRGLEHKLDAINAYYAAKLAGTHAGLEALDQEEATIRAARQKADTVRAAAQERRDALDATRPRPTATGWMRLAAMLALTVLVVVTNYFIVAYLAAANRSAWWLPAGIMGVGMFVLFGDKTVWSAGDEPRTRPTAMRWLTELAPPVSAAVFVGCLACRSFPAPVALAGSFFILVLFLFCGKLLLTVKSQLGVYHQAHRQAVLDAREHARALKSCDDAVTAAAAACGRLDASLADLGPRRAALRTVELALQAEALAKCEIFRSEHAFASALQPVAGPLASSPSSLSLNGHAAYHG